MTNSSEQSMNTMNIVNTNAEILAVTQNFCKILSQNQDALTQQTVTIKQLQQRIVHLEQNRDSQTTYELKEVNSETQSNIDILLKIFPGKQDIIIDTLNSMNKSTPIDLALATKKIMNNIESEAENKDIFTVHNAVQNENIPEIKIDERELEKIFENIAVDIPNTIRENSEEYLESMCNGSIVDIRIHNLNFTLNDDS
eukprot:221713_1